MGKAARAYAKQVGESLEMVNTIGEVKIRAERRAGELLGDMKDDGVLGPGKSSTLEPLGITKKQFYICAFQILVRP